MKKKILCSVFIVSFILFFNVNESVAADEINISEKRLEENIIKRDNTLNTLNENTMNLESLKSVRDSQSKEIKNNLDKVMAGVENASPQEKLSLIKIAKNLNQMQVEREKILSDTDSKIIDLELLVSNLKQDLEVINQELIKDSEAIINSISPTSSKVPRTGNVVLDTASKYLGTPYLWGGTSPNGFDCSGFTQYVFSELNIFLPRTTYTQVYKGTGVKESELMPGDLLFFGDSSSPNHVGIYWGNGLYIHAPQTGDVVKIASLNLNKVCSARRIEVGLSIR